MYIYWSKDLHRNFPKIGIILKYYKTIKKLKEDIKAKAIPHRESFKIIDRIVLFAHNTLSSLKLLLTTFQYQNIRLRL